MFVCFAVLVPFFLWDAFKAYHRIAGPIYRFQQTIKAINENQPVRPIKFRKHDELTEVQDDFNDMLKVLAARNAIELVGEFPPSQQPVEKEKRVSDACENGKNKDAHVAG